MGKAPKALTIPRAHFVCPSCHGTGKVHPIDGPGLRKLRQEAGISVRALAGRLEISPMYLSDLELGRRQFSEKLAERFVEECNRGQLVS